MSEHQKNAEGSKSQQERLVMPVFRREERYTVLKVSDVCDALDPDEKTALIELEEKVALYREQAEKQPLVCAVVESDWPEYEPTWKAIEERVKTEARCPQCNSWEGLKFPRGLEPYCEDCGWPDEDFGEA